MEAVEPPLRCAATRTAVQQFCPSCVGGDWETGSAGGGTRTGQLAWGGSVCSGVT